MLVKISNMYHGKYNSGPVFFVHIVLPEKAKHWNYCCASDSLLAFRLTFPSQSLQDDLHKETCRLELHRY